MYIYIYAYICIYVYICIHIYTYIYTHISTCIFIFVNEQFSKIFPWCFFVAWFGRTRLRDFSYEARWPTKFLALLFLGYDTLNFSVSRVFFVQTNIRTLILFFPQVKKKTDPKDDTTLNHFLAGGWWQPPPWLFFGVPDLHPADFSYPAMYLGVFLGWLDENCHRPELTTHIKSNRILMDSNKLTKNVCSCSKNQLTWFWRVRNSWLTTSSVKVVYTSTISFKQIGWWLCWNPAKPLEVWLSLPFFAWIFTAFSTYSSVNMMNILQHFNPRCFHHPTFPRDRRNENRKTEKTGTSASPASSKPGTFDVRKWGKRG